MKLEVITPDAKVFEGEAIGVKLPGVDGSFEILNNHAPIISALGKGELRITTATGSQKFTIDGGMVEMKANKLIVLAESIL
jgi:F-type H+-transporting ATPase subunit epsilon